MEREVSQASTRSFGAGTGRGSKSRNGRARYLEGVVQLEAVSLQLQPKCFGPLLALAQGGLPKIIPLPRGTGRLRFKVERDLAVRHACDARERGISFHKAAAASCRTRPAATGSSPAPPVPRYRGNFR